MSVTKTWIEFNTEEDRYDLNEHTFANDDVTVIRESRYLMSVRTTFWNILANQFASEAAFVAWLDGKIFQFLEKHLMDIRE